MSPRTSSEPVPAGRIPERRRRAGRRRPSSHPSLSGRRRATRATARARPQNVHAMIETAHGDRRRGRSRHGRRLGRSARVEDEPGPETGPETGDRPGARTSRGPPGNTAGPLGAIRMFRRTPPSRLERAAEGRPPAGGGLGRRTKRTSRPRERHGPTAPPRPQGAMRAGRRERGAGSGKRRDRAPAIGRPGRSPPAATPPVDPSPALRAGWSVLQRHRCHHGGRLGPCGPCTGPLPMDGMGEAVVRDRMPGPGRAPAPADERDERRVRLMTAERRAGRASRHRLRLHPAAHMPCPPVRVRPTGSSDRAHADRAQITSPPGGDAPHLRVRPRMRTAGCPQHSSPIRFTAPGWG